MAMQLSGKYGYEYLLKQARINLINAQQQISATSEEYQSINEMVEELENMLDIGMP